MLPPSSEPSKNGVKLEENQGEIEEIQGEEFGFKKA